MSSRNDMLVGGWNDSNRLNQISVIQDTVCLETSRRSSIVGQLPPSHAFTTRLGSFDTSRVYFVCHVLCLSGYLKSSPAAPLCFMSALQAMIERRTDVPEGSGKWSLTIVALGVTPVIELGFQLCFQIWWGKIGETGAVYPHHTVGAISE